MKKATTKKTKLSSRTVMVIGSGMCTSEENMLKSS